MKLNITALAWFALSALAAGTTTFNLLEGESHFWIAFGFARMVLYSGIAVVYLFAKEGRSLVDCGRNE
jgi:hypothetical protein